MRGYNGRAWEGRQHRWSSAFSSPWFLAAAIYVGGYFALSVPNSGPYERMFYTRWQCDLYLPLVRVEQWFRGELVVGFRS